MSVSIEKISFSDSKIDGLKIVHTKTATEERGTVRELYRQSTYSNILPGTISEWKQINLTRTKKGAVRGLHGEAMSKLVTVAFGSVFGVYVDTRPDSKTVGFIETIQLKPGIQVFVPQGVCNGFQALEDDTEYLYFFDQEWVSGMQGVALSPLDPQLSINWPIPINVANREQISEKDANAPNLKEVLGV